MRNVKVRGLIISLISLTAVYAVAEDVNLTTLYPFPRGIYEAVRVMNPSPGASMISIAAPSTGAQPAQLALMTNDVNANNQFDPGDQGWLVNARSSASTVSPNNLFIEKWNAAPAGNAVTLDFATGSMGFGTDAPGASLQVSTVTNVPNSCGGADWINPATQASPSSIRFGDNPAGGCGDDAYIAYYGIPGVPDKTLLEIANPNDADDHIAIMPAGGVGVNTTNVVAGQKLDVEGWAQIDGSQTVGQSMMANGQFSVVGDVTITGKLVITGTTPPGLSIEGPLLASDVYLKNVDRWLSALGRPPIPAQFIWLMRYPGLRDGDTVPFTPPDPGINPITNCAIFTGEWALDQPEDWTSDCANNVWNNDIVPSPATNPPPYKVVMRLSSSGGCSTPPGTTERVAYGKTAVYAICIKP